MKKDEKGQESTRRWCHGKHIDDVCRSRGCKNAEYGCAIQELKKPKRTSNVIEFRKVKENE